MAKSNTAAKQTTGATKIEQTKPAEKTPSPIAQGQPGTGGDEPRPRKKREETVSCTVPKAFKLQLDHGETVDIREGIQDLPRSHADHWYAKANGVEINEE